MKKFAIVFVVLIALCNISRADNILIYHGVQSQKSNSIHGKVYRYFWLFDVTTSQYLGVQFGGAGDAKFYSVGTAAPYFSSPVTDTPPNTTRSYFAYDASTSTAPNYDLNFGYFSGLNTLLVFSSSFQGQFPIRLGHVNTEITGNGTSAVDATSIDSGEYLIDVPLSRVSNDAGDSLSEAATLVTKELKALGYSAE